MLINGKSIGDYGATLLYCDIENSEIVNDGEFWAEGALTPFPERQKIRWGRAECEFLIEQDNNDLAEKAISNIIKESMNAELVFENRNLRYRGIIDGRPEKENVSPGKYLVTVAWKCQLPYEDEVATTLSHQTSKTIVLPSNATTPAILEVTPSENLETATITGVGEPITLKNLTAGQTIIIDGEKGLVTENGQNKWPDYDSWGFPRLEPGDNKAIVDTDTLDITIRYKPRWI